MVMGGPLQKSSPSLARGTQWIFKDLNGEASMTVGIPMINSFKALQCVCFTLNGKPHLVENPDPDMLLVDFIRYIKGLTGTKKSCGEGGCGACTVLIESASTGGVAVPVNACLRPLCSVHGQKVITIEGVQDNARVAASLASHNGSQCGFCSPGMVMSMQGLLAQTKADQGGLQAGGGAGPSPQQVERQFEGNLCRCTGYRAILDAMQTFAVDSKNCPDVEDLVSQMSTEELLQPRAATNRPLAAGCGAMASAKNDADAQAPVVVCMGYRGRKQWVVATSAVEAWSCLSGPKRARLVAGNTAHQGVAKYYNGEAWGVAATSERDAEAEVLVDVQHVPEMTAISFSSKDQCLSVGGAASLSAMQQALQLHSRESPSFQPMADHLEKVANHQVRSVGTVAGNLMLARRYPGFVSALATLLAAADATLHVVQAQGELPPSNELVEMGVQQFLENSSSCPMLMVKVSIPAMPQNGRFLSWKVARRSQNAHAIVNAAFALTLHGNVVTSARVVYGGIRGRAALAPNTQAALTGRDVTQQETLDVAMAALRAELVVDPSMPGEARYRESMLASFLYKTMLALQPPKSLCASLVSAIQPPLHSRQVSKGALSLKGAEDPGEFPISEPVGKLSALAQCEGQARYTDDIPLEPSQLHGAFVLAPKAGGVLKGVDASFATSCRGVVMFIDAHTMVQSNLANQVSSDEALFLAVGEVSQHEGQRVGLVLAESQAEADLAARHVKVEMGDCNRPLILTLDDAIAARSFYSDEPGKLEVGDAESALASADVVVNGSVQCGHQYHFYMETQTADAKLVDGRGGAGVNLEITSATQNPKMMQQLISKTLNKPMATVEVKMERAGGGYGGKANRSWSVGVAAAVGAHVSRRAVRIVLDLNTNMRMLGSRRPHRMDYKVGASKDGKILAVTGTVYMLQGAHADLDSGATPLDVAVGIDNAYMIPHWRLEGFTCKSDTPGNTFCRGPSFTPGVFLIESALDHVAQALGLSPDVVRQRNLYSVDDVTPLGQQLHFCHAKECWDRVQASAGYAERALAVREFNAANRWVKRAVVCLPQKYGMARATGYTVRVGVQDDGSVLVQQSGCEIGQGLNVKVAQVVARTLGCALEAVHVDGVSSKWSRVGTGGSTTSEGNCASALLACQKLIQRMAPFRTQETPKGDTTPQEAWVALVAKCAASGVDLQAQAALSDQPKATDGIPPTSPYGDFQYLSYGAACVQVQLDVLTGTLEVMHATIVHDGGVSLNPLIDAGQAQGGFVMGLGYHTSEEHKFDPATGRLLTNGTWEYKPPSSTDIPEEMNVEFLDKVPNPLGVLHSKAVGEPPLLLGCAVVFAARAAVQAARIHETHDDPDGDTVLLNSPITAEQLHAQCTINQKSYLLKST